MDSGWCCGKEGWARAVVTTNGARWKAATDEDMKRKRAKVARLVIMCWSEKKICVWCAFCAVQAEIGERREALMYRWRVSWWDFLLWNSVDFRLEARLEQLLFQSCGNDATCPSPKQSIKIIPVLLSLYYHWKRSKLPYSIVGKKKRNHEHVFRIQCSKIKAA